MDFLFQRKKDSTELRPTRGGCLTIQGCGSRFFAGIIMGLQALLQGPF
jgi:hypothetical protein